jgi:hypothetical protein
VAEIAAIASAFFSFFTFLIFFLTGGDKLFIDRRLWTKQFFVASRLGGVKTGTLATA